MKKFAQAKTRFAATGLETAGIRPAVPLDAGIARMVDWYLTEGASLPIDRSLPPAEYTQMLARAVGP